MLSSGEFEQRTSLYTPHEHTESPLLTGLAIAALYLDSAAPVASPVIIAEVAKRYGIVDPETKVTPPSIRSLKYLIPALFLRARSEEFRQKYAPLVLKLSPDWLLPMSLFGSGDPSPPRKS